MSNKIILASASPRRRELLKRLFNNFEIKLANIEENTDYFKPDITVMSLALEKALVVAKNSEEQALIIAADTVVYLDEIIGKPENINDAKNILNKLADNVHTVYTGVALVESQTNRKYVFSESAKVYFKALSDDEIDAYIKTGEPLDKAGAYAIQGLAAKFISRIDGDYYAAVGLPLSALDSALKEHFSDYYSITKGE